MFFNGIEKKCSHFFFFFCYGIVEKYLVLIKKNILININKILKKIINRK